MTNITPKEKAKEIIKSHLIVYKYDTIHTPFCKLTEHDLKTIKKHALITAESLYHQEIRYCAKNSLKPKRFYQRVVTEVRKFKMPKEGI